MIDYNTLVTLAAGVQWQPAVSVNLPLGSAARVLPFNPARIAVAFQTVSGGANYGFTSNVGNNGEGWIGGNPPSVPWISYKDFPGGIASEIWAKGSAGGNITVQELVALPSLGLQAALAAISSPPTSIPPPTVEQTVATLAPLPTITPVAPPTPVASCQVRLPNGTPVMVTPLPRSPTDTRAVIDALQGRYQMLCNPSRWEQEQSRVEQYLRGLDRKVWIPTIQSGLARGGQVTVFTRQSDGAIILITTHPDLWISQHPTYSLKDAPTIAEWTNKDAARQYMALLGKQRGLGAENAL